MNEDLYGAAFMKMTEGKAPTVQNLLGMEKDLNAKGYKLSGNRTLGPDGKPTSYDLVFPNGAMRDVIKGAARGGEAWQVLDDSKKAIAAPALPGSDVAGNGIWQALLKKQNEEPNALRAAMGAF